MLGGVVAGAVPGRLGRVEAPGSEGMVGSPGRLGLSGSEGSPGFDGAGTGTLGTGTGTFGVGTGTLGLGTDGTGTPPESFGGAGGLVGVFTGGVVGSVLGFGAGEEGTFTAGRHLFETRLFTSVTSPPAALTAPEMFGIPDRSLTRPNSSASTLATSEAHSADGGVTFFPGTFGRQPAFCSAVTSPSADVMRFVASSVRGGTAVRSPLMPGNCATSCFARSEHVELGGMVGVGVPDLSGVGGLPGVLGVSGTAGLGAGGVVPAENATAGAATDAATATDRAAAPTAREIFTVQQLLDFVRILSGGGTAPARP